MPEVAARQACNGLSEPRAAGVASILPGGQRSRQIATRPRKPRPFGRYRSDRSWRSLALPRAREGTAWPGCRPRVALTGVSPRSAGVIPPDRVQGVDQAGVEAGTGRHICPCRLPLLPPLPASYREAASDAVSEVLSTDWRVSGNNPQPGSLRRSCLQSSGLGHGWLAG